MAFKHLAWAMHVRVGDPLAKLVLLALADRADKESNECWPSLQRLCDDTEMSKASITRKLKYLEEHRLIERRQRGTNSTLYVVSHGDSACLTQRQGLSHTEPSACLTQSHKPISEPINEPIINQSGESVIEERFEEWWTQYPKKMGRGQALKAYRAASKKATHEELYAGVLRYQAQCRTKDKQYIAHASTWLNGERWLDEDEAASTWGNAR